MNGVTLDAATQRPVPGATVLVVSRSFSSGRVEHRRYDSDAQGRLHIPERRGRTFRAGLTIRLGHEPPWWLNEHTYMAPGYAWLRVPVGKTLGDRPPDRVLLTPLPAETPRLVLTGERDRDLSGDENFELSVPACRGVAQGLREGGGLLLYWDPRYVVMAGGAQEGGGGLWLEGGAPGEARLQVVEGSRLWHGNRAFLDPLTCRLRVTD